MIDTAIIYTRTNSKRFKNKALVKVYKNKSLIESVVQNTFKIKSIKKIIVATTKSKKDLIFEKILKKYKVKFFYGSTNDLIDRSLKCSSKFKLPRIKILRYFTNKTRTTVGIESSGSHADAADDNSTSTDLVAAMLAM